MDELKVCIRTCYEYCESCAMVFTETWLHPAHLLNWTVFPWFVLIGPLSRVRQEEVDYVSLLMICGAGNIPYERLQSAIRILSYYASLRPFFLPS